MRCLLRGDGAGIVCRYVRLGPYQPSIDSGDAHPLFARHGFAPYAYGSLLLLLAVSMSVQLAAADENWSRFLTVVLQSAALVAAVRISGAHHRVVRFFTAAAVISVAGSVVVLIGDGQFNEKVGRSVAFTLIVLATVAVVFGIVRQVRADRGVTLRTMFGVLCVYLLVGMAFASSYGVVDAFGDEQFFAQTANADQSDFMYFSFATVTTTGWGDLTAATGLGRSLAVAEALFGQIYLVTVVALIVGNLGRRPGVPEPTRT